MPDRSLESAVVSRLIWRLMPFLFLLYIVAYLDRINVSFAILQMRGPLHLNDRVYGRAAGMFFAGYFLFQVPSNIVLEKVGVRRWISGLMVVWGVVSCCMMFRWQEWWAVRSQERCWECIAAGSRAGNGYLFWRGCRRLCWERLRTGC